MNEVLMRAIEAAEKWPPVAQSLTWLGTTVVALLLVMWLSSWVLRIVELPFKYLCVFFRGWPEDEDMDD